MESKPLKKARISYGRKAAQRGQWSEDMAMIALQQHPSPPFWLGDIRVGTVVEDRQGVDLIVTFTDLPDEAHIQVKSSHKAAEAFEEMYRKIPGPPLILIVVTEQDDFESVRRKIMKRLERMRRELLPDERISYRKPP